RLVLRGRVVRALGRAVAARAAVRTAGPGGAHRRRRSRPGRRRLEGTRRAALAGGRGARAGRPAVARLVRGPGPRRAPGGGARERAPLGLERDERRVGGGPARLPGPPRTLDVGVR